MAVFVTPIRAGISTDYLLGGALTLKNGRIDKYYFEGGFARAFETSATTDRFVFYYYNKDHLGNNREVVDIKGRIHQVTNYYPFGAPYADENAIKGESLQPYKYNGKELDLMHGLNIPKSSKIRSGHGDAITTNNLHNELMRKLYDRLCSESGKDNVGTEIRVGTKRIDAVVKGSDFYDLYEVKTALNPFDCVTEALGQLCQYAYLFCRDKIGKMVIVGVSESTKEVEQYLATLRKNHSLSVYYVKV
jgi:hypothetical protein